jgi:hypothetical protein
MFYLKRMRRIVDVRIHLRSLNLFLALPEGNISIRFETAMTPLIIIWLKYANFRMKMK